MVESLANICNIINICNISGVVEGKNGRTKGAAGHVLLAPTVGNMYATCQVPSLTSAFVVAGPLNVLPQWRYMVNHVSEPG